MNETFRLAKLYVNHCGFSCVPVRYQRKELLFKGVTFQQRPPTLKNLQHWFLARNPVNIAIVPGAISDNLCILDFDDFGTWSVFHSLTAWAGPIVRTGRGVHVYVRLRTLPDRNGQGFFNGAHFGQIIVNGGITAPPSVHPSGKTYHWHGSPEHLPYLPDLDAIGVTRQDTAQPAEPRALPSPSTRRPASPGIAHVDAYVSAAVQRECEKILSAPEGGRNRQLYLAALKLAKYAEMLPAGELSAYLDSAARQAGLRPSEIRGTIASGFRNGFRNGTLSAPHRRSLS